MPSTPSGAKAELRRHLRDQRRAVAPDARRLAAQRLASALATTRAFRVSRRIACYLPADGEIDTAQVVARIAQLNKICYLPVLSRIDHDRMWFAPARAKARFVPNRYGILEPRVPPRLLARAHELDLVLLPLVGFDLHGHRLGMGGGYYDRSLAYLAQRQHWRKPHVIGLAYDFQKVERLPREPWDIPLDAVVTDQAVYVVPATEEGVN